jgi:hypothetical protein
VRRTKLVLAALAVAVASFMAFAGPAMAVQCDHLRRGVIECGKNDNLFFSENRFLEDGLHHGFVDHGFHNGFVDDEFLIWPHLFGFGFAEEVPVWTGNQWCEVDLEDDDFEC